MNRSMLPTMGALLLAVTVTACGESTTGPDGVVTVSTADVAVSAADQVAAAVALMLGSQGAASLSAQRAPTGAPMASLSLAAQAAAVPCTYSGSTESYSCPSTTEGSFTVTRSFTLFDEAGAAQALYDAATTASIDYQVDASGTVTRTGYAATYDRHANLTVSGLAGAETERTWNGTGADTAHAEFQRQDGVRAYDMTAADTVDNVVFRLPTSTYAYPISGRIIHRISVTQTLDADVTVSRTAMRRVVATFDGTDVVALRVGAVDCSLSLATNTVTCAGQH